MSIENLPTIEHDEPEIVVDTFEPEVSLNEDIHQVERGRFREYADKLSRVAVIAGLAVGALVGPGEERAEAAPAPCYKGVQVGAQVGRLCITKEEVRASGTCSTSDRIIGITAMAIVMRFIPVGGNIKDLTGYGFSFAEALRGGFCD